MLPMGGEYEDGVRQLEQLAPHVTGESW